MENFSDLHEICVKVFDAVSKTTAIFILPLFMARIVFANVMGEGSKAFAALKGALIYFCLVASFPLIIEILFSIPDSYLPKYQSLSSLTTGAPEWSSSSIIPFSVDRILEVILAGLYWIVYYLHVFFMLVMCSMAPVVFLASTVLGVGLGLEIFMGLLIVGSSWPIIWYGFDQVHASLVTAQTDEFGAKCLELLLTLFKGLSPVAFASLAVKSPAGRAISQATQASISSGKWAIRKATGIPQSSYGNYRANRSAAAFGDDQFKFQKYRKSKSIYSNESERFKKAQKTHQKGVNKDESPRPRDIQT